MRETGSVLRPRDRAVEPRCVADRSDRLNDGKTAADKVIPFIPTAADAEERHALTEMEGLQFQKCVSSGSGSGVREYYGRRRRRGAGCVEGRGSDQKRGDRKGK
jgi:hypothetical protein